MSAPPSPTESQVLRANAAFYTAFTRGDHDAMDALWAARATVTCLHPGASLLRGRETVLAAWRAIMTGPLPFEMRCHGAEVQLYGDVAVVTCYEGNGEQPAHLAATNVFVLEDGTWRMAHHQAGPLSRPFQPRPSSALN